MRAARATRRVARVVGKEAYFAPMRPSREGGLWRVPRAGRAARGGRRGPRAARESVRDLWRPLGRARGLPVAQDGRARSPPATQHPIWKASWRGALANSATRHPRPPSSPLVEADFLQGTRKLFVKLN